MAAKIAQTYLATNLAIKNENVWHPSPRGQKKVLTLKTYILASFDTLFKPGLLTLGRQGCCHLATWLLTAGLQEIYRGFISNFNMIHLCKIPDEKMKILILKKMAHNDFRLIVLEICNWNFNFLKNFKFW